MHVGIIGGGIAGLVAAHKLAKAGLKVTLLERANKLGGLAGSFTIQEGQEIERYYHFICKPDHSYLEMLRELGTYDQLRWVTTEMGFFYDGHLYTLGDPLSLFMFPHLSFFSDKVRFAWATLQAKFRDSTSWREIEGIPARDWLIRTYGQRTYDMLYKPLLDLKFGEYAPRISAAWMWARFHRLGNSRTITQKERVGYLDSGTQLYINALERALRQRGAEIRICAVVERILVEDGHAQGVVVNGSLLPFDHVISTVPIPVARAFLDHLQGPNFDNLRRLEYIDVMVMVLRLKYTFSKYFWMNVSDPRMDIAGIIEYTNLNPCPSLGGDAILYIPRYLPSDRPLYQIADEQLFVLYCTYLTMIRPDFKQDWVRQYWVFRDRFAQPICQVGFSKHIPDIQTPIPNLYMTDSYQLHPHDRTVSNSTALGNRAASLVLAKLEDS